MTKNFVIEVLETFDSKELEEFRCFLESPYFNRGFNSRILLELYQLLAKAIQTNSIEKLEKEQIFEAIYPDKPRVDSKIDKLMSELKGLLQIFLNTQSYLSPENALLHELDSTRALRIRNLENRYQQSLEKLKKEANSTAWGSTKSLLFKYQLAVEEHEWQSVHKDSKGDLNIPDVLLHFENYYYAQKTELLNRLLLLQTIVILPEAAKHALETPWQVPPEVLGHNALIDIAMEIHQLFRENPPKIEGYYNLIKTLQDRQNEVAPETLVHYYTYLRNICINLINAGQLQFFDVLHAVHKDNLERGYFYFQNKITPNAYFNITHIALRVNDIEWAKAFVEQHKGMVTGENETKDFYHLNKALCLFAEKKFEEALEITPLDAAHISYHLMARRLELKIYYELDSELLPYKIDAFKMYISRAGNKALSKNLHELHVNFINFVRQLSLSPEVRNKERSAQMIKRISEKKLVAEAAWLLEKARELGERRK